MFDPPWHGSDSYLAFMTVSKAGDIYEAGQSLHPDCSVGFWRGMAEIYASMSPALRRRFFILLSLMFAGGFADVATIGAVIPFLSLLSSPQSAGHLAIAAPLFSLVSAQSPGEKLAAATAAFCLVVIAGGAIRFELARLTQHFAYQLNHELMLRMQRLFLFQPYSFHVERNTSTLLSAVDKVEGLVFDVFIPLMQALIGGFMALLIMGVLVAIEPATALIAAITFLAMYLTVSLLVKTQLKANSGVIAHGFDERLRIIQESLGGIRDVIIDGSQSTYLDMLDRESSRLNRARANTTVISSTPRFAIETIGILAIAGIALFESQRRGGFAVALPVLGAIAIGAQRLLPLIQQVFRGWSTAAGYLAVVGQTAALLRLPADEKSSQVNIPPLELRDKISVESVSFAYRARNRQALQDISFDIPVGCSLALIGETGSGKSTLADLIMGLIDPDKGRILIDDVRLTGSNRRRWQRSIAHVPQSVFLTDATIAQNIALSRPDSAPDHDRIVDSAKKASLHDFVMSLPAGYDTFVGERGVRLSGGQRQRLGLARAIYKNVPVLVLDEATSALDVATEAAVLDAIERLAKSGRTVVIIAHRLTTIARCDRVVQLHQGRLVSVGTFAQVVGDAPKAEGLVSRPR